MLHDYMVCYHVVHTEKLQYFETIFPLVEKQDDVYFRGGGAAGGL